jgi:chromatin remodeling complex protein RSC6
MSALPSKSVPKKLTKTLPAVEAPVVAVPVVEAPKKMTKAKAAVAATPAPAATAAAVEAPVVTAQPVATEAAAVEEKTWQEELRALQEQLTTVRDAAASALAASKRLERRVTREVKDARKNRRRQRAPLAEGEERKPSIFQIPVPVTDELSLFLGGGKNNQMSRSQVTKAISAYVKANGLNDKHKINPNPALRKLLTVKEGDELTIFNMQSYLQKHYVKAVPTVTA